MLKIFSFFKNIGLEKLLIIALSLFTLYIYDTNKTLKRELTQAQESNLKLIETNKNNQIEIKKIKAYYENAIYEITATEKEKSKIKTNIYEIKSKVKNISSKELISEFNIVLSELFDTKNNNSK